MASLTFPVKVWVLPAAMPGTTANPVLSTAVATQTCNIRKRDINPPHCSTLSRQSLLHSALLARLQVEGVTLHFSDDVFRLNLALETPEGVLHRLAFLQSNFCHTHYPPDSC